MTKNVGSDDLGTFWESNLQSRPSPYYFRIIAFPNFTVISAPTSGVGMVVVGAEDVALDMIT
jgi:hypothetical protein